MMLPMFLARIDNGRHLRAGNMLDLVRSYPREQTHDMIGKSCKVPRHQKTDYWISRVILILNKGLKSTRPPYLK